MSSCWVTRGDEKSPVFGRPAQTQTLTDCAPLPGIIYCQFFFVHCCSTAISEKAEGDAEMQDAEAQASAMAKTIKAQAAGDAAVGGDQDDELAAYKLDEYDEEESKGAGELAASSLLSRILCCAVPS